MVGPQSTAVLTLLLTLPADAKPKAKPGGGSIDSASCAACHLGYGMLARVLNRTKTELEQSKAFNDKKAQKVDKVQKAQTRRWLGVCKGSRYQKRCDCDLFLFARRL